MNKKFNASKVKSIVVGSVMSMSVVNTCLVTPYLLMENSEHTKSIGLQSEYIKELQTRLQEKETEIQQTKDENSELNKSLKLKDEELEEVKTNNEELKNKNNSLESKVKSLKAEKEAIKSRSVEPSANKASNNSNTTKGRKITMEATAYHEGEPGNAGGRTATGIKAQTYKTIAVDPRVIPLHSKVYVEFPKQPYRNGYYYAHDTGGAIKGKIIDVFVGGHKEMYNFGRQTVHVYL